MPLITSVAFGDQATNTAADIHPDTFYQPHSSSDPDDDCHRGRGTAGVFGAPSTDCDAPYSLVNETFAWIERNVKDQIDFVVWTGDSARHDRDEALPRTPDQVLGANKRIADMFMQTFGAGNGNYGSPLAIPVVPTFGNNDILPHNILLAGPNKWLRHYAGIWHPFIPEEQRHSFDFGGWFHVEVVPGRLAVFSLNTLYFFDRNAGVDGCADPEEPGFKQLEWLRVQLQLARQRGMKAIIVGHVPPARTKSKKLWDETCWHKYALWMHHFRDVVVAGLFGHMNIDHFLIHDKGDIDISAVSGAALAEYDTRIEGELSVESASDYLLELRRDWAKLKPVTPPPTGLRDPSFIRREGRRGGKNKQHRDPWGERYHLSLVGPSVVPTYFPTLRIIEYNISGLEEITVWSSASRVSANPENSQKHLDLRDFSSESDNDPLEYQATDGKKKKKKKKKKKQPKKPRPHDPNLVIPSPPSPGAPPGPAYSPQPFTLTGYTQYVANLTLLNSLRELNDTTRANFYVVEYSTFEDEIYQLRDLTVGSMVELAMRMGKEASVMPIDQAGGDGEGLDGVDVEEDEEHSDDDDHVGAVGKKKGKKGKKKKGKKKHVNKTWLHFLKHAFVSTVSEKDLKKLL